MARAKRQKTVKARTKHGAFGSATAIGKRGRGRPSELTMPEPIDAPPERIAEVVLRAKPKDDWQYLKEHEGHKR